MSWKWHLHIFNSIQLNFISIFLKIQGKIIADEYKLIWGSLHNKYNKKSCETSCLPASEASSSTDPVGREYVIASWRQPRPCVQHRKWNYQLILLAVVDAWSCCCLDTVLLLSASDVECAFKNDKGRRRAFSDARAHEWQGKRVTDKTLKLSTSGRRASCKARTLGGRRKDRQPTAWRAFFVCVLRVWSAIEILVVFTCSARALFIFTLLALRRRQLTRPLTLANSAGKPCCCPALTLS